MNGKFDPSASWEKASAYRLDNGWLAVTAESAYGEHVVRLESPDGRATWHCSNGVAGLPEFARAWLNGGEWFTTADLVRPRFTVIYE